MGNILYLCAFNHDTTPARMSNAGPSRVTTCDFMPESFANGSGFFYCRSMGKINYLWFIKSDYYESAKT